jgi:UDP-N-acetylmuramyl pentapeptide phosphotransferase/UDP-N-acetylglucosamine-1-phosphate transferase
MYSPLPLLQIVVAAFVTGYLAAGLCRATGWVDRPGGRKDHVGEIPLAGGIAIFA